MLCKTYLSDLQPLCKSAADIVYESVLEIVPLEESDYIYFCAPGSGENMALNSKTVRALRQRSDLVFGRHVFSADTIYGSESGIAWETGDGSKFKIGSRTPILYNMTYSCIPGYTTTVISIHSNSEVTTTRILYIEGREGMVRAWQAETPYQTLEKNFDGAIHYQCNMTLSAEGKFFVGDPGTQLSIKQYLTFQLKAPSSNETIPIQSGILNNLNRKYLSTLDSERVCILQYFDDGLDFILPIGGKNIFLVYTILFKLVDCS